MTSVPPPSQPPASLHTHPELPDGVAPPEPPPGRGATRPGSLSPVPAWAPLAAMIAAFVVATLAYLVIAAVVEAGGGNVTTGGPPGLVISATLVQDAALIIAAVYFASLWVNGLTPASFGLRRVPLGPAAGWTVLAFIAFWVLTAIYISAVGQPDQQELTRDLREEESLAALIGYGLLLAFVAPLAEELFFRGFVFGVLREKIGTVWGVLATGVRVRPRARGRLADRDRRGAVHPRLAAVRALPADRLAAALHRPARDQQRDLLRRHQVAAWTAGVAIVVASTAAAVAVAAAVTERPGAVQSRLSACRCDTSSPPSSTCSEEAGRIGDEVEGARADLEPRLQVRAGRGHDAAAAEDGEGGAVDVAGDDAADVREAREQIAEAGALLRRQPDLVEHGDAGQQRRVVHGDHHRPAARRLELGLEPLEVEPSLHPPGQRGVAGHERRPPRRAAV